MSLKTDYKDDMYDGQRRYRLIQNEDGTYSLPDATTYTQKGDRFGANDINAINEEINRLEAFKPVSLPAAGWSADPPYEQTVSVPGITAADNPIIALHIPDGATAADVKAWKKAWGMVDEAITADGQITYRCYIKKPVADFTVAIKGV